MIGTDELYTLLPCLLLPSEMVIDTHTIGDRGRLAVRRTTVYDVAVGHTLVFASRSASMLNFGSVCYV
jgi:hypothetical protein